MFKKVSFIICISNLLLNPYVKTLTYFPQHKTLLFDENSHHHGHIARFEREDAVILLEDIGREPTIHKKIDPVKQRKCHLKCAEISNKSVDTIY